MLAPIIVNSFKDDGDGSKTTLREAIAAANLNPDSDTITFDASLNGATINLTIPAGGELSITKPVTIDASALSQGLTIVAADNTPSTFQGSGRRIFNIDDGTSATNINVEIDNLTLTGGSATDPFGGGAILAHYSDLNLTNVTAQANTSSQRGGAIMFLGNGNNLTVNASTISGNTFTNTNGGGRYADAAVRRICAIHALAV